MSLSTLIVAAGFRGRVDAFEGMVRTCHGDVCVLLTPGDDAIRRTVYDLRFAGMRVHGVERRAEVPEDEGLAILTGISVHYLGSDAYSPVRSNEAASANGALAHGVLKTIVLRTTTFPGPAHKEYLCAHVRPLVPRSIYVPLHVPENTSNIRLTLEDLGPALVDVLGVRVFRTGHARPSELDPAQISDVLTIAGRASIESRSLRSLAAAGAIEFDLDVLELALAGPCDAIELCVCVAPIAPGDFLTTAGLDRASRAFRDPRSPQ